MMSRMTPSSKTPFRNLQHLIIVLSIELKDRWFSTHFQSEWRAEIFSTSKESYIMMINDVKDDPILKDSSQEPSTSSKYDFEDGGFLKLF